MMGGAQKGGSTKAMAGADFYATCEQLRDTFPLHKVRYQEYYKLTLAISAGLLLWFAMSSQIENTT